MKTETQIENYKAVLADAKKEFGDFTQSEAWEIINKAAHSIETQIIESNYAYSNDSRSKTSVLFRIASRMRKDLEDEIGPQPGFSPRRTIEKPNSTQKIFWTGKNWSAVYNFIHECDDKISFYIHKMDNDLSTIVIEQDDKEIKIPVGKYLYRKNYKFSSKDPK